MTDTLPATARKRRPAGSAATEKRLLAEVLDLKDQVHNLVVAIERSTNAHAQSQMLAQRDVAMLADKVKANQDDADKRLGELELWQAGLETERSEQRGAARVRGRMLAAVAGLSTLAGGLLMAVLNWFLGRLG